MPEAWVRAAILVRINSLIRGHSGVQWETVEKLRGLLVANITPVVPIRGSISASGGEYAPNSLLLPGLIQAFPPKILHLYPTLLVHLLEILLCSCLMAR